MAVVPLAKRRGAEVIGVTGAAKSSAVRALGADRVLMREAGSCDALGEENVDVLIDNVASPGFVALLKTLRRGGCYVSSGAIAGPIVEPDMHLKDITLIGCTPWDEAVFPDLISYIEKGQIRPLLAATYPLERLAAAQQALSGKTHVGKIVQPPR